MNYDRIPLWPPLPVNLRQIYLSMKLGEEKESSDSEGALEISIQGQPEGKALKGQEPKLLEKEKGKRVPSVQVKLAG